MDKLRKYRLNILIALLLVTCFFADWAKDRYDFARTYGAVVPPPVVRYGVMTSSAMALAAPRGLSGANTTSAFMSNLAYGTQSNQDSGSRILNGFSDSRMSLGSAAYGSPSMSTNSSSYVSPSAAMNPTYSMGMPGGQTGVANGQSPAAMSGNSSGLASADFSIGGR